jgi:hypothetical protein
MQVQELVTLGRFLQSVIKDQNLLGQYQQLIEAVNKAAQNQEPENVAIQLAKLRRLHQNIEEQVLSPAQAKLMHDYGAHELLGRAAIEEIDKIFLKHQANPHALASSLSRFVKRTTQLVTNAAQLVNVVEPLIASVKETEPELAEGEGRLWLYFEHAASVTTLKDLEKAAETWKQVLHNFSRMPGASDGGGRILQIQKRSPLELEIAAAVALLAPLAYGIHWLLGRIEHVIKILQEAERLKQMKISTKITKALIQEAKESKENIAEEAANAVVTEFEADNEVRNAVQQALSRVLEFIEKGGQLDIDAKESVTDHPVEGIPQKMVLRDIIRDIRKEMKLLPPPSANESENGHD